MTIRVVLADDQHLVRAGLRGLLTHSADIEVVGEAADGVAAVAEVRRALPDVVLMDIRMPTLDGIAATRAILTDPRTSGTRIVVLTTFDDDENVFAALHAGASGFLTKDAEPDHLRAAVRVVAAGEALLAPGVTRRLIARFVARDGPAAPVPGVDREALSRLTEREREVTALAAEGLSNAEIAARLHMSPDTARTHIGRAMVKLDVHDRAQLVVLAYRTGLVRPPAG
jgi:DNA-binding NarL/FixJ family response regulator